MKTKLIITVTSAILVLASGSFIGIKNSSKKPVDKNINVEVYKTASYIAPAYANTFATLEVTIVRVNGKKKDTAFQHMGPAYPLGDRLQLPGAGVHRADHHVRQEAAAAAGRA